MGHADLLHVLLHFLHPNSNSMERPRGLTVMPAIRGKIASETYILTLIVPLFNPDSLLFDLAILDFY